MALIQTYTPLSLNTIFLSTIQQNYQQLLHSVCGEATLVPFAWYGIVLVLKHG